MIKRNLLLSLVLALATSSRAVVAVVPEISAVQQAPVLSFPSAYHGMSANYKASEATFLATIDSVLAIPSPQRNFANTVDVLDKAEAAFGEANAGPSFMEAVSPDKHVQRMASAIDRRTGRLNTRLADRDDLYQAYKDVAAKNENLTGENRRLLDKTLRDYQRRGMDLPAEQRARLNAIRNRLADLGQAFSNNLKGGDEGIEISPEGLKGLPKSYVDGRPVSANGLVKIKVDYPSYGPFMDFAEDSELRRQLFMLYQNRGAVKNIPILEEVIPLRHELASLLGKTNFAEYVLEERMAKTPATVTSFYDRLRGLLAPGAAAEEARLLEEARADGKPGLESVAAWDRAYYSTKLQKRLYDIDAEDTRPYFPVDKVIEGTMKVYQNLLGVTFTEKPAQAWDPTVRLFEITDSNTGASIGHFFLDLYPRDHKYQHMAAFTLISGRELPDGTYRKPVSAMVGNFTPPTASHPSLLAHDEVETFFHEFGHLMHQTLTKAHRVMFSGSRTARDFVETPSQMLENFVWQPEVLELLSGHWQDPSRKLPKELLDKLLAAKNFNMAVQTLRQVALGALDMAYHTATGPVDVMEVQRRVWAQLGLPPPVPGTHFPANFGHLMGYAAGYYGYLWSRVYAQDVFTRFEAEGIANPAVGADYRREILEVGSTRDELDSLRAFMGREPNERAFLRYLGLPDTTP